MHEATDFEHMKRALGEKKKENYSQDPRKNRGDIVGSWDVEIYSAVGMGGGMG